MPGAITTGSGEPQIFLGARCPGSPLDITVAEMAIESFYPLDGHTAAAMRTLALAGRIAE